MIEDLE